MAGGETSPGIDVKSREVEGNVALSAEANTSPDLPEEDNLADQNNNIQILSDKESNTFDKHTDLINNNTTTSNGRCLRARTRSRNRKIFPEKVHHKRQTLQDMARPLKQWLYRNKVNPYPTKSQKLSLAAGSHMTLVQVSNWFANARRRLKNVVKGPNITWARRVKMYNDNVVGNAELFSISSDDSVWDWEEESEGQKNTFPVDQSKTISVQNKAASDDLDLDGFLTNVPDEYGISLKYKQTILQRYLSDAYQRTVHVDEGMLTRKRDRRQSGSLGSRDFEEMSTSSASSRINDVHFRVHNDFGEEVDFPASKKRRTFDEIRSPDDDIRQKEMDAIFALTSLAESKPRM